MRIILFIFLFLVFSCSTEDCYKCKQEVTKYSSPIIKGYPKKYTTSFIACGENIDIVRNGWVEVDTINDTVFTLYINKDCVRK